MDGIHGGRGFLITADLHVLLGTDCTARRPPTRCQSVPIRGCLEGSVVQNQQADADYAFSRYNGADLHVSLSFLLSFSYPAAWNESRDTWVFCYLQSKDNRTAVWEVSRGSLVFAEVFRQNAKVNRLLENCDCFLAFIYCLKFLLFQPSYFNVGGKILPSNLKFILVFLFPNFLNVPFGKSYALIFNASCNQDKLCLYLCFLWKNMGYTWNRH